MEKRLINSQMSNYKTYEMYKRQLLTLAENVFDFKNLPKFIDTAYFNKSLLRQGSIAFFVDEVMGLLALPYTVVGRLDVYNRPKAIKVFARNGYTKTITNPDEFVIMYDNNGRYPMYLDIVQYAERIAQETRTIDINIMQQRTPRIWKTKAGKEKTLQDLINNVDGMVDKVVTYEDMDIDDTTIVLEPAPYVADSIQEQKEKDWNEFLRLIGIANQSFQKRERNIKDEVLASQGGTIASRYSRFEPRKKAVDEINEKFGEMYKLDGSPVLPEKLEVSYYDGLPSSVKEFEDEYYNYDVEENESEVVENDTGI